MFSWNYKMLEPVRYYYYFKTGWAGCSLSFFSGSIQGINTQKIKQNGTKCYQFCHQTNAPSYQLVLVFKKN
jgi:hypothetical protein